MQTAIIANEQSQIRHSQMSNKYETKKNIKNKTKKEKQTNNFFFTKINKVNTLKNEKKTNTKSTFMVGAVVRHNLFRLKFYPVERI
jgi:alpha/beta superfamily hydrolase